LDHIQTTDKRPANLLILFPLWLLVFSASSQIMIIAPILPQLGKQLAIPEAVQGTLITSYAFMVGLFALIMGPVSDRIGRRKILLYGTLAMTIALAMHTVATGYTSMLLIRAITGAAGGILSGSAVSYVGDYFPYEKRGWANGWIMSGAAAGQIVGIPLGTVLSEMIAFYAPFLVFAVTMAVTFVLIWKYLPQPNVERNVSKMTIGAALNQYGTMLHRSDIAAASLAYFVMFLSISMFIVYLPTWLTETFSIGATDIATMFLIGGVANVITGPQAGKLSDRIGRKKMILFSCIGTSILMFSTTFIMVHFTIAYILFFLVMVLVAMRISPFQALLSEIVSGKNRGTLMSLTVALGQVGFGVGGAVAGFTYTTSGYMSNTIFSAILVLFAGYIIWTYLPEPELKKNSSDENSKNDVELTDPLNSNGTPQKPVEQLAIRQ
jgi:predicted MFS family arabinose efflux permease